MGRLSQLLQLMEKFSGGGTISSFGKEDVYIVTFVDPKPSEIKETQKASGNKKCIRFFVDFKKKEVTIWPGNVFHYQASEFLKKSMGNLFCGVSVPDTGKMKIVGSDDLDLDFIGKRFRILKLMNKHKKLLQKYFTNTDEYLQKFQPKKKVRYE